MMRAIDGPAAGAELALRQLPAFLRVVIHEANHHVDALDQPDDEPGPSERIYVYRRVPGTLREGGIACVRHGKGRGCYSMPGSADYEHVPGVDGERFRDTGAWWQWETSQLTLE